MVWTIKYSETALKALKKLDKAIVREVIDYLNDKIARREDATTAGKALSGTLAKYWRYRVRDMRAICYIDKGEVTILILQVGHRSGVYDDEAKIASQAADAVETLQNEKSEKDQP
ncbi:MAG: type II toxin-antitoxin system RelE/ParE family toxin [Candidatus Obscuribacterales bacterium]|nr:type II toxin-antitoxin system RelE/ParE family toxin [Candidatus Obscuribacterales bacterium]